MAHYIIGILGMWLACDGIISIRLYKRESWLACHSIRIIRIIIGAILMVLARPIEE